MSVHRRGDVWHYDFSFAGARYRGSTGQRGKAAALREEARYRETAKLGKAPRPIPTLREAADRWFIARMDGKKSASTTAFRIEIMLRHLGPDTLVTDIDTPEIADAIQARRVERTRQGRAPTNATVNRDLVDSTTRPILRYCRTVLKVEGMQSIDWPELKMAEPKGRSRDFTRHEIEAWRAHLPEWHRPVFDFLARYGVRLREAFFPLSAVEPQDGFITIRTRKNGLPHIVDLIEEDARDMAARYGRAREAGLPTVWFRETGDGLEPIHWRGFQSASRKALERAGIKDARAVHDLRHHAATAFLRLPGADLKQVQQLLGHESITSTARYAHVSRKDVLNTMRHTTVTMDENEQKPPMKSTPMTGT